MMLVGKGVIRNGGVEVHWKTLPEATTPEFSGIVTCRLVGTHVVVGYQVRVVQNLVTLWGKDHTTKFTSPVHTQKLTRDAGIDEMVTSVRNLTWCMAECESTVYHAPLTVTRSPVVCNNIGMSLRKQLGLFAHPFLYQETITRLQG